MESDDFLDWAMGIKAQDSLLLARGIQDVYASAAKNGFLTCASKLDDLDSSLYVVRNSPKPIGYVAQTACYFGGKAVIA